MKKIIKLFLLFILLIPISVKADMGAPEIMGYYVTPKSMDGANYYDGNPSEKNVAGTIMYGDKVQVIYESSYSGELIGTIEIGNDSYDIYLKDYITVSEYYKPSINDSYTEKVNFTGKVLDQKGLKMYKGPSEAYESYDFTIPFGTEIKVEYRNMSIWLYGEYNGTKGWFMFYEGSFGIHEKSTKEPLLIAAKVDIKESLSSDAKTLGTIPALESLEEYYILDPWAWSYYVTYNGVTGYIDSEKTLDYVSEEYKTEKNIVGKDVTVYETAEENAKKVGTLKALKVFYIPGSVGNHSDYYYIECDDLKGFIPNDYEDLYFIPESDEYYYDLLEGKITYEEYLKIDEDEEIDDDYEEELEDYYEDEEIDEKETEEIDKDEKKSDTSPADDKSSFGPKEMVILCVGGAVIVALTAIVTIILVNKKSKKNSKKEEKQPEIINNNVVENASEIAATQVAQEQVIETPVQTEEKTEINDEIEKDSQ